MSMKIIHKRDIILGVLKRWNEQYQNYGDAEIIGHGDGRGSIIDHRNRLAALDLSTCTSEDVDEVLRATGWAENKCDECQKDRSTLIHIGDEPDYDARWSMLCLSCLSNAADMLRNAKAKK